MKTLKTVINGAFAASFAYIVGVTVAKFLGVDTTNLGLLFSTISLFLPSGNTSALSLKVLWGAGVVDGRGKLNGWVFAKNKSGNYARVKVTPTNPQTQFQAAVRAPFGALAQSWKGLTEIQRQGWRALAENTTYSDIFGNAKKLSGLNLYIQLNQNLITIGEAEIQTAPTLEGVPAITSLVIEPDATAGDFECTTAPGTVPANTTLVFYATAQQSPGAVFTKGRQRVVDLIAAGTAGPFDIFTKYENRFGTLTAGKNVGVYARLISTVTGEAGTAINVVRPVV